MNTLDMPVKIVFVKSAKFAQLAEKTFHLFMFSLDVISKSLLGIGGVIT